MNKIKVLAAVAVVIAVAAGAYFSAGKTNRCKPQPNHHLLQPKLRGKLLQSWQITAFM